MFKDLENPTHTSSVVSSIMSRVWGKERENVIPKKKEKRKKSLSILVGAKEELRDRTQYLILVIY